MSIWTYMMIAKSITNMAATKKKRDEIKKQLESREATPPVHKPRVNQPPDYSGSITKMRFLYCKNHDYRYYQDDWVDKTGKAWKAGYYDENGGYHKNVSLRKYNGSYENVEVEGPKCKTLSTIQYWAGTAVTCSECGQELTEENFLSALDISEGL